MTIEQQISDYVSYLNQVKHYMIKWRYPADYEVNLGVVLSCYVMGIDPKECTLQLVRLERRTQQKNYFVTEPPPKPVAVYTKRPYRRKAATTRG